MTRLLLVGIVGLIALVAVTVSAQTLETTETRLRIVGLRPGTHYLVEGQRKATGEVVAEFIVDSTGRGTAAIEDLDVFDVVEVRPAECLSTTFVIDARGTLTPVDTCGEPLPIPIEDLESPTPAP